MSRQRIIKDLPPLKEAFHLFGGFPAGYSRQETLTQALRQCALHLQREQPRPFYAMREVASHFEASLRTTALAYQALDMEGLLHRIRGSQTMLAGKSHSLRQPVTAIVGLPIWLTSMILSPFESALQMELDERLRSRGFVADSIFFRTGEECEPDFATRLLRHNLDILVWQSPHPLSSHVLMSLRERGVRLVLLQSLESPLSVPARNHLFDWQTAHREMAARWQAAGIRRVTIPRPTHLLARRALKSLVAVLEKFPFELRVVEAEEKALAKAFPEPARPSGENKSEAIAFIDPQTADLLCNGYPDLIERLSRTARLAFCRGPVRVPRLGTRRIGVDVVELDPAVVAQGVVDDLCDPQQKHEGLRQTFRAEYHAQILMKSPVEPAHD